MIETFLRTLTLIFFAIVVPAIVISVILSSFKGAPFIPTGGRTMRRMLELAKIKKGEKLYDLGAGDGRFVIAAAKLGAQAVGIEVNPFQVWWCKFRIFIAGVGKNAKIIRGNIFDQDLCSADIITCYLFPDTNKRLQPKFLRELKPGTRIVSHLFRFHGWNPVFTDEKNQIYVYEIQRTG